MTTLTKSYPRHSWQQPNDLPATITIPSLEPGDRLTRAEFERRYAAMPQGHIQSRVFSGLRLNAAALLAHDLAAVLQAVQSAMARQPIKND